MLAYYADVRMIRGVVAAVLRDEFGPDRRGIRNQIRTLSLSLHEALNLGAGTEFELAVGSLSYHFQMLREGEHALRVRFPEPLRRFPTPSIREAFADEQDRYEFRIEDPRTVTLSFHLGPSLDQMGELRRVGGSADTTVEEILDTPSARSH